MKLSILLILASGLFAQAPLPIFSGSGGGGGAPVTPGGSSGQCQYNNAGAFGGVTGCTSDGTTITLVAPILGTPASATLTNATGLPAASVLSGALVNGMAATTQSANDNSTKLATTAYADRIGTTTNQKIRTIGASFGSFQSGASALTAAATACVPTYFSGTIQSVEIIADVTGIATIDVKTVAHSSWTGTASTSSITASDIPTLVGGSAVYTDTTLTGWTTALPAGNVLGFNVISVSGLKMVTLTLGVTRN